MLEDHGADACPPPSRFIGLIDLFARSNWGLIMTLMEVFHDAQEVLFGDTIRYRVLKVLMRHGQPVTLIMIANELSMSKAAIVTYRRLGRLYFGRVRRAVLELLERRIIKSVGDPTRSKYELNLDHIIVQYLVAIEDYAKTAHYVDRAADGDRQDSTRR